MDCSMLGFPVLHYLRFMPIESVMPSNHLILYRLLLPSILPSIRVFSNESALCISWPSTGVSVSASVLPMNIQGWVPLGLTGFDLLAVQGTVENLFQHHNLKTSVLWCSAFLMAQPSHSYMTSGKTALTIDLCQPRDVSAFSYAT